MRRILLMTITASLLALGAPAAASAHHRAHGARAHRRRHRHSVVHKANATPGAGGEAPSGEVTETAGTIASYEEGVLKVTLADGSTVAGKVTEYTQIQCGCPGHQDGAGWHRGGGDGGRGWEQGDWARGQSQPGDQPSSGCGASSLVAGAKVQRAALLLTPHGAIWAEIDLASS